MSRERQEPAEFDDIISLGGRCQIAHQLRRIRPYADRAFPFDWLITPDASLLRLLEHDFADFLRLDGLAENATSRAEFSYRHVVETRYGIVLTHDFKQGTAIAAAWPAVRQKYVFLIDRWRSLLASDRRILFIRQSYGRTDAVTNDLDDLADAAMGGRIAKAIACTYPRLRFRILCLTHRPPTAAEPLPPGIDVAHVPQRTPWSWTGCDAAWNSLLARHVVLPVSSPAPQSD
jgi:hypothetical protein